MGVLNISTFAPSIVSVAEAELILNEGIEDDIDDEPEMVQYDLPPPRPARRPRQRSINKGSRNFGCGGPTSIRQNAGCRKKRRHENDMYLMNISLSDGCDDDEVFEDFGPVGVSAFTQLLMENDKMQAWNDFVNKSEEEQWKILSNVEAGDENNSTTELLDDEESITADLQTDVMLNCDIRNVHPAFSPEKKFKKLDRDLQRLLKNGYSEMTLLQALEGQLTSFFRACPKDVFSTQLESSFERKHLHALCQYLDLKSRSYNDSGVRHTKVKNPRREFSVPPILLSSYVEKLLNYDS